jgi:hypothetical protein
MDAGISVKKIDGAWWVCERLAQRMSLEPSETPIAGPFSEAEAERRGREMARERFQNMLGEEKQRPPTKGHQARKASQVRLPKGPKRESA